MGCVLFVGRRDFHLRGQENDGRTGVLVDFHVNKQFFEVNNFLRNAREASHE